MSTQKLIQPPRNIALSSDFVDYYDDWFASPSRAEPDYIYQRFGHMGPSRPGMFKLFERLGLQTPVHGLARFVGTSFACMNHRFDDRKVVVHLETYCHQGEGMRLMTLAEAVADYPDHFICEYVDPGNNAPSSLRYLRIGRLQFWLQYTSESDWRSNCGDYVVQVLRQDAPLSFEQVTNTDLKYPAFSIDFVQGRYLYAIDMNLSPRVSGTGVEQLIDSQEAFKELSRVIHAQQSPRAGVTDKAEPAESPENIAVQGYTSA